MSKNEGTLVIATVKPYSTEDTYPVADANDLKGGLHTVASSSDLDDIPVERLNLGMLCTTIDSGIIYQYTGTGWIEYVPPKTHKWTTKRKLSLTGDASGDVEFDGSGDITLNLSITNVEGGNA